MVPKQKLVVDAIIPYGFGSNIKYLMVKVADGRWGWPGGKIGIHEDIRDALPREVIEETSVGIVPLFVVDIGFMTSPSGNHIFRVVYEAKHIEGTPKASGEVAAIDFLSLSEIRALDSAKLRGKDSILRPLEGLLRGERLPLEIIRHYVDDYHPVSGGG